jgi:hypothetical protein
MSQLNRSLQFQNNNLARSNFSTGNRELDQKLDPIQYQEKVLPTYPQFDATKDGHLTKNLFSDRELTPSEQEKRAFNLRLNSEFNEQFNRDYKKQQELLAKNSKFLRTRQSLEVEMVDRIGRVQDHTPYSLYEENELRPTTIQKQAFGNQNVECNLLNQAFMSQENLDNLQDLIRYNVFVSSGKKHMIGRQDDRELQIIMRGIYLTYGKNLPYNIKEQIADLNNLVVQQASSQILSQIQQHLYYLFDANTQPIPLSLPENVNATGRKILPSVTSTFFT